MGTELLATGSVLAAFFAGAVALFAPCCIVFLAPSYLAAAVKNNRWRLLPLTFVFAAGLALVLVPITLGVSLIAGAIAMYHTPLYWAGGLLMIALGILAFTGRMWSMPAVLRAPDTTRGDSATFFSLGVFAGIASSCCAPVLAGVMTLSALSGNAAGGMLLGLAFVFGMVVPLLLMALAWDIAGLSNRRWGQAKPIRLRIGGRTLHTNTINLAVAIGFVAMGIAVILVANSTTMTGTGNALQQAAGEQLTRIAAAVLAWLTPIPEPVLGAGLLALAGVFVWATLRERTGSVRGNDPEQAPGPAPAGSCHPAHPNTHDHELRKIDR